MNPAVVHPPPAAEVLLDSLRMVRHRAKSYLDQPLKPADGTPKKDHMDVSIFLDRYRLQYQEKRERRRDGERTLLDLNWSEIIPKIRDYKGKSIRVKNGRHLAIVNAWKSNSTDRKYVLIEAGIFSPGKKPAQWKNGEEQIKKVELQDGHEWIHPSWFAIPLNGNQMILQATRNGPHVADISWWIKHILKCNYVDNDYVPIGNFYDGFTAGTKWKKVILKIRRKPGRSGSNAAEYHESELGDDIEAGKVTIIYEPEKNRAFSFAKARDAICRYVPGLSSGDAEQPDPDDKYIVEDCTIVPQEDSGSPSDVLSLANGMRRQCVISVDRERIIQRTQIEAALYKELKEWLGAESE